MLAIDALIRSALEGKLHTSRIRNNQKFEHECVVGEPNLISVRFDVDLPCATFASFLLLQHSWPQQHEYQTETSTLGISCAQVLIQSEKLLHVGQLLPKKWTRITHGKSELVHQRRRRARRPCTHQEHVLAINSLTRTEGRKVRGDRNIDEG